MDFNKTALSDDTFDVALAIESLCHSSDKPKLLSEIHRIMKSGGRFVDADGYFGKNKDSLTSREWEIARACCEGVHVPLLPEKTEFESWLTATGFSNIQWIDKTKSILPIARRVNRLARCLLPFSKIFGVLGFRSLSTSHIRAFADQYYAWRDGIGVYGIFYAKK
jgi:SAM-dependent methyltransferase